jgi:hypothetical protein
LLLTVMGPLRLIWGATRGAGRRQLLRRDRPEDRGAAKHEAWRAAEGRAAREWTAKNAIFARLFC